MVEVWLSQRVGYIRAFELIALIVSWRCYFLFTRPPACRNHWSSDPTEAQIYPYNTPAWRQSLIDSILSAGTFLGEFAAGILQTLYMSSDHLC